MTALSTSRRRLTIVGSIAAASVLALPVAAHAAETLSVSPSTNLSASSNGSTVAVSGTGYAANTAYRIGNCSTKAYGALGVPACGSSINVTSDANGNLSANLTVRKVNSNLHFGIPVAGVGQPSSFTCKGSATQDQCAVTVTSHNGSSSTVVAQRNITFQ